MGIGFTNYLDTTVTQSRRVTHIERYSLEDTPYKREKLAADAVMLRIRGTNGSTQYISSAYSLDEAVALRDGLTKIIDSIVTLRPKPPAFSDELDAAEVGSTVKMGSFTDAYIKVEGGHWMNTGTRNKVSSTDFHGDASTYTLTPPAPLTLPQRMLAAPFGSTVRISTTTYLKVGPTQDKWVNLDSHASGGYKAQHFTNVGDVATLTLAE